MKRRDAIRLMRANLLRRRSAICQSLDLTRLQLQGANDHEVGDSVDFALDAEHREISSQLAQVESAELAAIDVALERMSAGEYGVCDVCDRNIPLARLQAVPYTTLCVDCQREQEHVGREQHNSANWESVSERRLMFNGNGVGV
jgi:DnaK suppressor protein